jgi:hypothetical protein
MMGRMTLREVREALAAAKGRGAKASASTPIIKELESLARRLERELEAGAPAEAPSLEQAAEPGAAADGGARRGSKRSARPRGPRRR